MKRINKISIFVMAVGMAASSVAFASNSSTSSSLIFLKPELKTEFNSFMNARAKFFIWKNDKAYDTFMNVVNTYNTNKLAFYNMSQADQKAFLQASSQIQNKLYRMRGNEAAQWRRQVSKTTLAYKFAWELENQEYFEIEEIKIPEITM